MSVSTELDLRGMYDTLTEVVNGIDEKLDSLTDSETAGKRKIGNDLVEANKGTWGPFAENAVNQMKNMEPAMLAGVYLGLTRELRKVFDEPVTKHIEEVASSAPKTEPLITEEEGKVLSTQRSEAYQQLKHIVELAVSFKQADPDDPWPLPNVRRGARGKRGKRALSYYNWTVDGNPVPEDSNTPAGVAKFLGYEKAKEFTELLRGDPYKIDTKNPPAEFTVEAMGKQVRAVRGEDAPTNEELSSDTDPDDPDDPDNDETSGDED